MKPSFFKETMSRFTLLMGNKNYSSWSFRAWFVLHAFDIPITEKMVDLSASDFKAKILENSEAGQVPVLWDGDTRVWDTLAICEYLAETFPDKEIWPKDKATRALARSIVAEMHSGFFAVRQQMPMNCRASFEKREWDADATKDIQRISQIWTMCRERFASEGPYLMGKFSAVDAFYAPVVSRFTTYQVPLTGEAQTYVETLNQHPSVQTWMEAGRIEKETMPDLDNLYS